MILKNKICCWGNKATSYLEMQDMKLRKPKPKIWVDIYPKYTNAHHGHKV